MTDITDLIAPRGCGTLRGHKIRIMAAFDPDTFEEVEQFASRRGVTLAEALRLLVEWGLQSGLDEDAGP